MFALSLFRQKFIFLRITIALLLLSVEYLAAQSLFYNNGAQMYMNPGSLMIVKTNSVDNNVGRIDNAGELIIEGDFINSDVASGNANSTGVYEVQGNWVNNNQFLANQSTVALSGNNQLITGSQKTTFYNLDLIGNGVKTQSIDAQVDGELNLRDAELATDVYEMLVSNSNTNAMQRNTGFVSSLQTGKISRNTNQNDVYLFPTGSSIGTTRYRPIEITPTSTANNTYGVRLANVDATLENFDRNIKEEELCVINPNYYHHIHRAQGTDAADIAFLYDAAQDGNYNTVAHWQNIPQWENINATASTSAGFDVLNVSGWNDFSNIPFALANPAPLVTAFQDTTIVLGEIANLTTVANNVVTTYSWFPPTFLSCDDCPNPSAAPETTTLYVVTVNQGETCVYKDSVLVTVEADLNLWLPNAFTPNGDGENETLKVFGETSYLKSIDFKIFNRWGEKVFEALDVATAQSGWDGIYFGKLQDAGVYTYALKAFYNADIARAVNKKGSLTLIR